MVIVAFMKDYDTIFLLLRSKVIEGTIIWLASQKETITNNLFPQYTSSYAKVFQKKGEKMVLQ